MSAYDAFPYDSQPIPWAFPGHLAASAYLRGVEATPLSQARVLELGCGDGTNLLSLAFHNPGCYCLGVDGSRVQVEEGKAALTELGLQNIELEAADLLEWRAPEQPFDYVLVHGVFSWVPPEVQRAILRIASESLRPGGLLYLSYNCQPAWSMRGMVRDWLRRRTASGEQEPVASRVQAARAWAAALGERVEPDSPHPYVQLLAQEARRVEDAAASYLAHEYLSSHNHAFWFGDLVDAVSPFGFAYLFDALEGSPEGWTPESFSASVIQMVGSEGVAAEECGDLMRYRQFRASVFVRGEASSGHELNPERIRGLSLAAALAPSSDPFHLSDGFAETFRGHQGSTLEVSEALTKAVLVVLATIWPKERSYSTVIEQARDLMRQSGHPSDVTEEQERHLLAQLLAFRRAGHVQLRADAAPLRRRAGVFVEASALTRFEAAHRQVLSTPVKQSLPCEELDRALIRLLDGSRRRDELVPALLSELHGEDTPPWAEGLPPGSSMRQERALEALVERSLASLGWWGLLVGEPELDA